MEDYGIKINKKKKVTFFHPYFVFGGVEKTNLRLAKYLISQGYEVDFIALSFSTHLQKEIEELGIHQVELHAKRTLRAIPELKRYIAEERQKYELTFISCQNYANLVAIFSWPKNRDGIKLIVSERSQVDEFKYNGKAMKGKAIVKLMSWYYRRADVIVANSKETAEDLTSLTGKKAECIYNPTLSDNYEILASEAVEHPWFQSGVPVVLGVGRLSMPKGFDDLIKAFSLVLKEMDARLVILGEGEKRGELESLVQKLGIVDKVWMPGYDKNPYKYIKKSDVFVLSSRFEGLPNVLIESLALKIPCVATRCKSGPREILLDGECGYLVDVGNVQQMADAIIKALTDQKATDEMLDRAEKMLYRFRPEEVGKQYLEMIEQKKRKVAFFHPYFVFGGVEKTNLRLSKYLISQGYEVDFIALSFSEHLDSEIKELGIHKIELNAKRTLRAIPELKKYIKEERKKYILTFISCQNYANLVAIFSWPKNRSNIKLLVSERLHPEEFKYNGKMLKGKVIVKLMSWYYKRADAIIANSKETADDLTKLTGKTAEYIYNPTLSDNYEELANMPVNHPWFQSEIPVIIGVGRLALPKGFDTLIRAFAILQKKMDARLVILGEGDKREELNDMINELKLQNKVWMPGYEKNPYRFIKKSDLFVLSSLFEGLPNVLIEALALGVPCVSTRCKSGPREILLEGKGGYLVDVGNAQQMADAMEKALVDKKNTEHMLQTAMNMLYRFTPQEVGKQYLEVIER